MTRLSAKNSKVTNKKISSRSLSPKPYSFFSTQDNVKFGSITRFNMDFVTTGGFSSSVFTTVVFNATGTWICPEGVTEVEYLVVGGGGSSGSHLTFDQNLPGGGGAGGFRTGSGYPVTPGNTYTITVGAGATAVYSAAGTSGSNSVFDTITSYGGGGGGRGGTPGGNGGSGGGGSGNGGNSFQTPSAGGVGIYPGSTFVNAARQGYDGGAGQQTCTGGGGGAGGAGVQGCNYAGGAGGPGLSSSITGTAVTYAAGGSSISVADGPANSGNGGSGTSTYAASGQGSGGSGVVILRYQISTVGVQIFRSTTQWICPVGVNAIDYLIVAGGGGGGGADNGNGQGGGGAGGFVTGASYPVTAGNTYTITVGSGGSSGAAGSNSAFHTFESVGGGAGFGAPYTGRQNGGSGGGGGYNGGGAGKGIYPGSTYISAARQGYDGGSVVPFNTWGGGGGGAGGAGQNASPGVGGNGGIGLASSITGVSTYYAGGGGGGGNTTGGLGGGANGVNSAVTAASGTAGTGGGGAGVMNPNVGFIAGGAGGSGIVIIKTLVL